MNKVFFSTEAAEQNKIYRCKNFTNKNLQTKNREMKIKIKFFGYAIIHSRMSPRSRIFSCYSLLRRNYHTGVKF